MDFKAAIAQSVAAATDLEAQDVAQMLETPPSTALPNSWSALLGSAVWNRSKDT